MTPALPAPDPTPFSLLLATGLPLVLALWWQWRRARRAAATASAANARAEALEQALAAAPDGWFIWLHHAEPARPLADAPGEALLAGGQCSRRLAVLLDLYAGREAVCADVLAALEPEDAGWLVAALRTLRTEGEGFSLLVRRAGQPLGTGEPPRRLRASGIRAVADDGAPLADLLWLRDVSEEEEERQHLAAHAARLEDERRRLLAAFDALPLPLWVRDAGLRVVAANRAFLAAVEAPEPAALRDGGTGGELELAGGVTAREIRALAAAARAAGEPRTAPFPVVLAGRRRLMDITEAPLIASGSGSAPNPGGDTATVGIAQDLTRLESLRVTLEREVSSHAAVLERLRVAIAIYGPDTRLRFHNAAFARLWGLDPGWLDEAPTYGEILETLRSGRRLPEVADFPAFREAELARFKGSLEPVEDLLHLPDGGTLRRVLAPHPLGGLLATYEDVTDRLALEAARASLEAVQRETLSHLREAVALFTADGRLALHNPAFRRLWGLEAAATPEPPTPGSFGITLAGLVAALPAPFQTCAVWGHLAALLAAAPAQRQPRAEEVERADGTRIAMIGVPLPDGGLLVTFEAVSDARRLGRAMRPSLATLAGLAGILAGGYYGPLNARQAAYVQALRATASRLGTRLDSQLAAEGVPDTEDAGDAGDAAAHPAPVEVPALLAQVLEPAAAAARAKGVALNFDAPPDLDGLTGDAGLLRLALNHLLDNAVRHTSPGGQITLAAQEDDGTILFTVADTGPGITEGGMSEEATTGDAGGLAQVRRIAARHGGTFDLVSVPGEGTTTTLILPASPRV